MRRELPPFKVGTEVLLVGFEVKGGETDVFKVGAEGVFSMKIALVDLVA